MCLLLKGQWEWVTVFQIPRLTSQSHAFDVILGYNACTYNGIPVALHFSGAHVYATARRPLSRRDLLALPIPIAWLK